MYCKEHPQPSCHVTEHALSCNILAFGSQIVYLDEAKLDVFRVYRMITIFVTCLNFIYVIQFVNYFLNIQIKFLFIVFNSCKSVAKKCGIVV